MENNISFTEEELLELIKVVEEGRQKFLAEMNYRLGGFEGQLSTLRQLLAKKQNAAPTEEQPPADETQPPDTTG